MSDLAAYTHFVAFARLLEMPDSNGIEKLIQDSRPKPKATAKTVRIARQPTTNKRHKQRELGGWSYEQFVEQTYSHNLDESDSFSVKLKPSKRTRGRIPIGTTSFLEPFRFPTILVTEERGTDRRNKVYY